MKSKGGIVPSVWHFELLPELLGEFVVVLERQLVDGLMQGQVDVVSP